MAKRTGLGRGIGALIPTVDEERPSRPVDVFFPGAPGRQTRPRSRAPTSSPCPARGSPTSTPTTSCRTPHQPRTDSRRGARRARAQCPRVRRAAADRRAPARRPSRASTSSSWASAACAPRSRSASRRIPAVIKNTADEDMLRDALLENLHRANLNPLEEAPPTSSCSPTSASRRSSSPTASAGRVRRSPTPSACSSSRSRCSGGSRPAC